ncbi:3-hydroxyacyl-CoA dehydrogenase NAD-binding domain-containing protein [Neobacillus mesonae]|uniref:3-hydroxyacyl-CoA dehydrogenase NAD-binding domain-containing protein n=1 Tax=Neobacillus mesonae TaxID=1193713 RepID=UPI0020415FB9|nr:3-hydroxyacyl-CoA dehydrogenase NAD-binding domain-containing protein [Neobacillus mesonae]MCM3570291.1 3-hydroxyacyl-CoA dehydrogenase NAD-binding domain-containing protein [Neobacillus mesonae]
MDNPIKQITVVGTGVIGNGWIARFLSQGYDVIATDPAENAETRMREAIDRSWPALEKLGLAAGASKDRLTFEPDLTKAVACADLIQENAPEREEVKRKLLAEIDHHAKPNAIIASSTSGLMPSTLQADCRHPDRIIVAHPFNPVYLIPLVEIVGGKQTSSKVVEKARQFYQSINMKPLVISAEIEGHVADRLMEAIWREALHLVNDGIATTEEVDAAIIYGPGLRWALMGPFLTLHLAGGEQGMKHMLEQFGPALKLPWTKLEAPELTEELSNQVIGGCERQTDGHSISFLEKRRDDFLIELQQLLEKYWPGANLNGNI